MAQALTEEEILGTYIELQKRVWNLIESPIGQLQYKLRRLDPKDTPPLDIRNVGKIVGKMDALKILLHSLETDLGVEIIELEKRASKRRNKEENG